MTRTARLIDTEKKLIFYHRAYRKFPLVVWYRYLLEFLLLTLFFSVLVFTLYPLATKLTSFAAKEVLSLVMPPGTLEILEKPFFFRKFYYIVNRIGMFPSATFLLVTFIVTLLIAFIVPRLKQIQKSFGVWIGFVCVINLISCFFFLFFADRFPYDVLVFSDLYMKTQVTMWFLISVIIPLALAPFPVNLFLKTGATAGILFYSLIFGCLRYIVFLYIITKFSYLFMPVLFFTLGPLLDFIYILGLYAFFLSLVAVRMKGDNSKWRWSY